MSSEVLGLPLDDLPDDATPLAAVVMLKMLDAAGEVAYCVRATDGLSGVEAVGMGIYGTDRMRESLRALDEDQA